MIHTLPDLLPRLRRLGRREAFRYSNGFRTWTWSYQDFLGLCGQCARRLNDHQINRGDRLLLWGENHPAWAAAFWAAVSKGIEVVPADYKSSPNLVSRIQQETQPRLIVVGETVDPEFLSLPTLSYEEICSSDPIDFQPGSVNPDDVVEIVYTSGTTSAAKGVVHRHRNICANLNPLAEEFDRYRYLAAPFQPIRILNLLPLSHMFGQSLALFIPPLLGGSSVFIRDLNPPGIMEVIKKERVSVLVTVPRILDQLRSYLLHRFGPSESPLRTTGILSVAERWIRHRDFHLSAGLKFWAIVVGGAPLEAGLERFWNSIGVLAVQGYGLTEASPIVSLNHPLKAAPGTIGKPLRGQKVKIAADGEILVRGDNVVSDYLGAIDGDTPVSEDGWLRTGDLGEFDQDGNLTYRGRKADVLVTPEGLNVHPQDVEETLRRFESVSDAVVVGLEGKKGTRVHAALIMKEERLEPSELIRQANLELEPHQRIRSWSVWPEEDFPRTTSTLKVKRSEVRERLAAAEPPEVSPSAGNGQLSESLAGLIRKAGYELEPWANQRLDEDLGLSSLDRIELLSELQSQSNINLDEATFAGLSTVGDVADWLATKDRRPAKLQNSMLVKRSTTPRWTRRAPVRFLRNTLHSVLILPVFRRYIEFSVSGTEHLDKLHPPVVFAANHCSNLDTIAILAALPIQWRKRLAPAVRQEYFTNHFRGFGSGWLNGIRSSCEYYLAATLFNVFPIPQKMSGVRSTLRYAGELSDAEYCPLLFPEGRRSPDGKMMPFQPGIGMLAVRLKLPVVPIHIEGLFQVLSREDAWPKSGTCSVKIGRAIKCSERINFEEAAKRVENAVRRLAQLDSCSAETK